MEDMTKKYSNGEITIVWKPALCQHSTKCWKGREGLLSVFNPMIKPWINPMGGTTDEIILRVNNCPSKALTYYRNEDEASASSV